MEAAARCTIRALLPVLVATTNAKPALAQGDTWRTLEFQTHEVTDPDVAVSPDGEWLIFTMLGKLFRLSVRGGEAEQLTFGPYFDNDPVISPDGRLVAFQSDRDGSEGNIFLLTLASREVTQLTWEPWADSPMWAPDGQSLVYRRLERMSWTAWSPADAQRPRRPSPPAVVRRVRLAAGEPETLSAVGEIRSPFHLPDGRVGWAVVDLPVTSPRATTRVTVREEGGALSTLHVFNGVADPVVASPTANGLYARSGDELFARSDVALEFEILFAPLDGGAERRIAPLSGRRANFAVAADHATLFLGDLGHLWRIRLPGGQREPIAFRARVTLAIREPVPPSRWTPVEAGSVATLRTITQPRLSPDGSRLVFRALGRLWLQPMEGGEARRLVVDSIGRERDPAFSPDGRRLAFVRLERGQQAIQVMDLQSAHTGTVGPFSDCGYEHLTWSLRGEIIAAKGCNHQVIAVEPSAGTMRVLAETSGWEPWPQLSADGQTLYFQAQFPGRDPSYYRLQLNAQGSRESLLRLPPDADGMTILTNERWVAVPAQNRAGIRLASLGSEAISQPDSRLLRADGDEFSFTPDGSAFIYVAGDALWREPPGGGTRQQIPIRLQQRAPTPPALLLQRVRVLDLTAEGFGPETSLLIEGGRIRWIGSPNGRAIPRGTRMFDAGGRFAIPGLFDMHGHGGECGGARRLAYGVTSVRNMGGRLARQNAHADRSDFTSDAVPRCFYAGALFDGPQGRSEQAFVHLFDEQDAREHVRLWRARGAQFIKLYDRLPWPLQRAAADEARRVGLPVVAHNSTVEEAVKGVTLGYAGLTHWERFYDDVIQMFAVAGTHWEPTLGWMGGGEVFFRIEPERFFRATNERFRLVGDRTLRGYWAERLRTMRTAYRRGITFLPGTDGGPEGLALQWELEFYAEAGVPPLDILRFATQASARAVGAQAHLGTLEAGKLADLILLDANPLEDIRNTQAIWRVIKGGWVFDPDELLPNRN